jgi:ClpP class serine protease
LQGNTIAWPGTPEAVDAIYSLDGDTAHIKIEGPLSPEGPSRWDLFWGYGGVAYGDIISALDRAKKDPLVKSVILNISSPGGTIDGVDQTWQAIRSVGKPISTRAGSLLASAAYWLASGTDKIYADSPTSEIGSIGVLMASYDWSKWEENIGVKENVITSINSPDKAPDIATKHGRDTILARLDALERIFYSCVSEGRRVTTEHIAEHFGKGGLLVAADPSPDHEDAIRSGMIDGLTATAAAAVAGVTSEIIPQSNFMGFSFDESPLAPQGETISPAQAGTKQEGQSMNLSELLAAHPAAATGIEALKAASKTAGREEARAEYAAKVDRVIGVLTSEAYPVNIKTIAGNVLKGTEESAAFAAAVAVYDAESERRKSEAAQAETEAAGGLVADKPNGKTPDEQAIEAASAAALEKAKAQQEEVKKWV